MRVSKEKCAATHFSADVYFSLDLSVQFVFSGGANTIYAYSALDFIWSWQQAYYCPKHATAFMVHKSYNHKIQHNYL